MLEQAHDGPACVIQPHLPQPVPCLEVRSCGTHQRGISHVREAGDRLQLVYVAYRDSPPREAEQRQPVVGQNLSCLVIDQEVDRKGEWVIGLAIEEAAVAAL